MSEHLGDEEEIERVLDYVGYLLEVFGATYFRVWLSEKPDRKYWASVRLSPVDANATMWLTKKWATLSEGAKGETLAHEVCHLALGRLTRYLDRDLEHVKEDEEWTTDNLSRAVYAHLLPYGHPKAKPLTPRAFFSRWSQA